MLVVLSAVYGTSAASIRTGVHWPHPQTVPPERLQANALLGVIHRGASRASAGRRSQA